MALIFQKRNTFVMLLTLSTLNATLLLNAPREIEKILVNTLIIEYLSTATKYHFLPSLKIFFGAMPTNHFAEKSIGT